ncbi:ArfGap-domain-containing protein [Marasmius fiardii PR-910]|nr:ArfGap-domain-containing protein [Marasmius fiardii PR-910]
MSTNKLAAERNQKILAELAIRPGNDVCADCKARNPRWASHNLGIFICVTCASIHRKIGTHVTKVKSITMDTWTKEQVDRMTEMGNVKSNTLYCPNELRHPPPPLLMADERDSELEQYIRSKYEYKLFMEKPTTTSKPGASAARSQSTPLEKADKLPTLSLPSSSGVTRPFTTSIPAIPPGSSITQSRSFSQPMNPAGPAIQPRVVSQPLTQQQLPARNQSLAHSPTSTTIPAEAAKGGVWNDLISLQTPSANSSLPLQFSQQTSVPQFGVSNTPMLSPPLGVNGATPFTTMNGFPGGATTGMGMSSMATSMNPNATFGISSVPSFQQSSQFSTPNTLSQGFGATGLNPMAQQQQQQHMLLVGQSQVQSPQPMFAPQAAQGGGQYNMMASQGHSPQPMMSTTPQLPGQFMSPSPQLYQTQAPTQFPQQGFGGLRMDMGGIGYTQQQQQQPMFPGGNPGWAQPQGNFGGQAWGSM